MADEIRARFDRVLVAVQKADRRLRACETFTHDVVTLTRRHRQGAITDQDFIARLWDLVAAEGLDEGPERSA